MKTFPFTFIHFPLSLGIMTFSEYCIKKKINEEAFRQAEPQRWQEWSSIFAQMHPNSFTEQKKFLINEVRRRYLLS